MPIIELCNVNMSYENNRVISDLSLSVNSGDYLYIVGENGSGKTTLLRGLLGLKKLDSGKIVFGDELKQSEIGYLPQQTEIQRDFPASVTEVVRSGRSGRRKFGFFYSSSDKKAVKDAMRRLEISDLAKKCYHDLSGGQQQRVLLARAICASKKLLILDEPVSGLDIGASGELYDVIDMLNREGITIIMITHDINAVTGGRGNVLHIGKHKALFYGTCKDYKKAVAEGSLWEKNI